MPQRGPRTAGTALERGAHLRGSCDHVCRPARSCSRILCRRCRNVGDPPGTISPRIGYAGCHAPAITSHPSLVLGAETSGLLIHPGARPSFFSCTPDDRRTDGFHNKRAEAGNTASATVEHRDPDALRELGIQLALLNHHIGARLELKDVDLDCLNLIDRHGPLSPSTLARRAGQHPATMTGILYDSNAAAGSRETATPQTAAPFSSER